MKRREALGLMLAAATGIGVAGCTGGSSTNSNSGENASSGGGEIKGTITFQTWALKSDKFTPYFEDLVKAFEKKYPGTTVKWVDQPSGGYQDKILQQAESQELPDVMNLPPDFAYSLAKVNLVNNLEQSASDVLKDYVPGGLAAYKYDGIEGTFGFPWYLGTELNYWNLDLLKKGGVDAPPADFDETMEAAKKLATSSAKIPLISTVPDVKYLMAVTSDDQPQTAMLSDGKFHFDTPEAEEAISKYAEIYKLGGVAPGALTASANADTNTNNFYKGTVAWTTAGPGFIGNNLKENAPQLVKSVQATEDFGHPPLFVQGISVAANSKNQATALAFAKFVSNNENQVDFVKLAQGFFPGTVEGNNDPSSFAESSDVAKQNEATKLAAEEMGTAQVPNPPQFTSDMSTYSFQQIALAVQGKTSPKDALVDITNYCNQNIDD